MLPTAFDSVCDPEARELMRGMLLEATQGAIGAHGLGAAAMPRDLAVCHEIGHAIVGAAEGVAVLRIEVSGHTPTQIFKRAHGRNLRAAERRRLVAAGYSLATKHWGGWTEYGASPFPSDAPGVRTDIAATDSETFRHMILMQLGGICGELALYAGQVPEASSLDEVLLTQGLCLQRTGTHETGKALWDQLCREAYIVIRRHARAAERLMAAFVSTDVLEGAALEDVLALVSRAAGTA